VECSLYFSSEIPALLGFQAVGTRLWDNGLEAYLAGKTPFGEQTMFDEINVLPPAATLVCELGGTPRVTLRTQERGAVMDDLGGAADLLRHRLRTEVGRLLVADVPVAVVTSGGLDSSLVTALATRDRQVHAFNIAYRGTWPLDERHYAAQVADETGAIYHQVELDPVTFPALIEDVVWHLGQPNADPITLSTYGLFAAVRDAGFKVALTGDAADELFGGYARMRTAVRAAEAGADWYHGYLDDLAVLPARHRQALYTDEYRAQTRGVDAMPPQALDALRNGSGSALERVLRFEQRYRLPAYHLRRVDHLSMASSVEVRLPFCQRSVRQVAGRLTDRLRIEGDASKRTLYAAAAGLLPDAVLNRPKQPFTLPITAMLAPGWPLWEFARDMLAPSRLAAGGRLDPIAVNGLFSAQADRPDDTTALTIWALFMYEVWLEQFQAGQRRVDHPSVVRV
jgi:asparagine synthase (glutamine-hydrolysing)